MDFMTPRVLYEQNKIPYLCVDNTIHNVQDCGHLHCFGESTKMTLNIFLLLKSCQLLCNGYRILITL